MPVTLVPRTPGRPTTNHPSVPPADRGRSWLTRLFAGELALPAVVPVAPPPAARAPAEHAAVERALGCPDLFVLDTADRAARERVLADLARAAAGRGERVLVLSPDPAAADRIADAVGHDPAVRAVRALAADETPQRPLPGATRLTTAAIGSGRVEQLKKDAAAAVARLEADSAAVSEAAVADLRTLAARLTTLHADHAAIDAAVRGEADGSPAATALGARLAQLRAERDAALIPLAAERAALAARRAETDAALAEARQHLADGGKKSGFFARLLHKSKPAADPAERERQVADLAREAQDLADREAKAQAEIDAADRRFAAEREKQIGDEVDARRAALDARLAADRAETAARLAQRVADLARAGITLPDHPPVAAVDGADFAARRQELAARLAAERDRLAELARDGAETARRLLAEVQVVVGTPGSVMADPVFAAGRDLFPHPFGLLVLDHAEEVTPPDFGQLTRLADRWVLAGDASVPDEPKAPANGSAARHRTPDPTFAARLARLLDREPWGVEGDRLVCRLVHLPPERRRTLTREPVLDHPHVELRMTAGETELAEIAFPAATPVAEAKAFLVAQLGEVLLRPCGDRQWSADGLTACWPAAESGAVAAWVDLEPGVREKVVGAGPAVFTAAVAFDAAAGWDAPAAEAWLAARLPADPGRVAVLPRPAGHGAAPHRSVAVV
jgi:hypothetical protein